MQLGMVGLGRMGMGMTKRLQQAGHDIKTYDPNVDSTAKTLGALAKQLETPRHVWMMVPAGQVTEDTFQKLLGVLEPGDTIIDGGNSNFRDSQRRYKEARKKISFVDIGVSAGSGASRSASAHGRRGQGAAETPTADCETLAPEDGYAHVGASEPATSRDGPQRDRVRADAGVRRGLELMYHSEFDLDLSEIAGIWRYGSSCARGCSSCCTRRWSSTATSSTTSPLRRGLGRGPLDGQQAINGACRCR
jgi:6-phosphogluconate dehydrogenase